MHDVEMQRDNLRSVPHNVPVQLTSLVGREREVAAICELLRRDDARLLTLTGAPGIGKTRLGIEVATGLRGHFVEGIYFVNLASVTDPDAVVQAIATALGIRQIGDQSLEEVLSRFLSGRQILLVLDNFEHVLIAGPAVAQMLKVAPGLKVLATSRELLRLSGERDFPVPPLSLPPVLAPQGDSGRYTPLPSERLGDYASVQLFLQRATAYKSDFVLSDENAYIIAAICRKLDGLPLAIELAAARIRHLSPQAILDRLQDRLALLTGGAIDLPLRQRTLRATIEWSYGLLSEDEKRLFRRLAVFRGARTLEAIEAVCQGSGTRDQGPGAADQGAGVRVTGTIPDSRSPIPGPQPLGIEPLNGVASLVDKSLLQQAAGGSLRSYTAEVGVPRYAMLETLQEYAKEKLEESGEAQVLHKAHAIYFTQLAERAEPELHGPQQIEWLDRLESEQYNLQAALSWAYSNSLDVGLRLVAALNIYWNRRGYLIEGREWASGIVARARETGVTSMLEHSDAAQLHSEGSTQASMARALYTLGFIAFRQANFAAARDLLDESVLTHEQLQASGDRGDTRGLVESLNILGIVTSRLENMPARRRLHEKALELARQAGDNWSIARTLYQLGHVARLTGDYALGRSLFEESLALFKESGDKFNIGLAFIGIGQMAERQGDYQSARRLFDEGLGIFRELGDKWGVSGALYCLGCVHIGLRDYTSARLALKENLALTEELGTSGDEAETLEKLGKAAYFQGDYDGARLHYKRSLSLFHELGDKMGIAHCLVDLGGIMAVATKDERRRTKDEERPVSAARLLGTAQVLLESVGFRLVPEDQELFDGYTVAVRTQLGEQTFGMAWAEGQAMTIDQAIAYAQAATAPGQSDASDPILSPHHAIRSGFSGLTRREREVVALVSQGRSNRQIAAELVVSERTVEGHVNNILTKLGFRSRAQVAAWAVEKGLAQHLRKVAP